MLSKVSNAAEVVAKPPTVLVVDDEPMVRDMLARVLTEYGFGVVTASCGSEALALATSAGSTIDIALLDLTLPDMGGDRVIRELRRQMPELPVLLCSGYSEQEMAARVADEPNVVLLQKPYRHAVLIGRLRELAPR